jgi:hypothetical protein
VACNTHFLIKCYKIKKKKISDQLKIIINEIIKIYLSIPPYLQIVCPFPQSLLFDVNTVLEHFEQTITGTFMKGIITGERITPNSSIASNMHEALSKSSAEGRAEGFYTKM